MSNRHIFDIQTNILCQKYILIHVQEQEIKSILEYDNLKTF